ncbi:unnamed protein product [Blepharisma stoltei]|uniref:RRM domain-containing protein n=1 Tax=Blepharisma stoltei TaxID=1481888 RepID=A0AAU9JLI9_9CILI|nr:unnamed protein product [Blepharisma stoltei]
MFRNLTSENVDDFFRPTKPRSKTLWDVDIFYTPQRSIIRQDSLELEDKRCEYYINKVSTNGYRQYNSTTDSLPIPKGDSPYALAKRAEYVYKDLSQAKLLYQQAIDMGHRAESAIKDLASILHQEKKTKEACELLMKYSHIFTDQAKFRNLYENLQRQIIPSGNCLNQSLRLSPLAYQDNEISVKRLFKNPGRIVNIKIKTDPSKVKYAIIEFASHSAARKTLESFHRWEKYKIDWLSVSGEVVAPVIHPYHKRPDAGVKRSSDSQHRDYASGRMKKEKVEELSIAEQLLGRDLFAIL